MGSLEDGWRPLMDKHFQQLRLNRVHRSYIKNKTYFLYSSSNILLFYTDCISQLGSLKTLNALTTSRIALIALHSFLSYSMIYQNSLSWHFLRVGFRCFLPENSDQQRNGNYRLFPFPILVQPAWWTPKQAGWNDQLSPTKMDYWSHNCKLPYTLEK